MCVYLCDTWIVFFGRCSIYLQHHVRGKKEAYGGHHTAQLEGELARSIRQEERWLLRLKRKNNARIGRLRQRIWQKLQDELQSHSKVSEWVGR